MKEKKVTIINDTPQDLAEILINGLNYFDLENLLLINIFTCIAEILEIEELFMIIDEHETNSLKTRFLKYGLKNYIQKYINTDNEKLYNSIIRLDEEFLENGENKMILS